MPGWKLLANWSGSSQKPELECQIGPGALAKTLGFRVYTVTPPWEGPVKHHSGGSRPALPGLHDVLCRSRSSGSFGLRVAVVEPSAKTSGFGGFRV